MHPVNYVKVLKETFEVIRRFLLWLNRKKCLRNYLWKVPRISHFNKWNWRNPNKIHVVANMRSPSDLKGIQQINGIIISLNRFISKWINKYQQFFKLLKKNTSIFWNEDCEIAFHRIKWYLDSTNILVILTPREMLYLYLVVTSQTLSIVILVEREILASYVLC